jgi:hypothetical protein
VKGGSTYLEVRVQAVLASIRVINEILDVALRELKVEAGGLGIPLLHGLFDEVKFDYEEGRGNLVVLKKRRVA